MESYDVSNNRMHDLSGMRRQLLCALILETDLWISILAPPLTSYVTLDSDATSPT